MQGGNCLQFGKRGLDNKKVHINELNLENPRWSSFFAIIMEVGLERVEIEGRKPR